MGNGHPNEAHYDVRSVTGKTQPIVSPTTICIAITFDTKYTLNFLVTKVFNKDEIKVGWGTLFRRRRGGEEEAAGNGEAAAAAPAEQEPR